MIWHTDVRAKDSCSQLPQPQPQQQLLSLQLLTTPTKFDKPGQKVQKKGKRFNDLLKSYWQKYCQNSTIHGVRYIYDPNLRGIERLIWIALVMTCVTMTCFSYLTLSERYSAKKLQTVVANSQYPVFRIPFPAVGICTENRINWQKLEQAKAKFLPPSPDETQVNVFTDFVTRMETLRFGHFDDFKDMEDINLELIGNIDVTELARFMAIRCEDIFLNGSCFWRKTPFECCTRFILENTEHGYCLVFNSKISPESLLIQENLGKQFYPYHNSRAGEGTGLTFRLKLNAKFKSPLSKSEDTITVLIKRPAELTNAGYTIIPNTSNYFIVRPQVTNSDDDLHSLDPIKRNCYFYDEIYLMDYKSNITNKCMLRNCLNKCHEEYMLQHCNCTMPLFFLFAADTTEKCTPSKFRCLAKNNDIFNSDKHKEEDAYFSSANAGMTCSCLIPCNVAEYFTSITTLPLKKRTNDTGEDAYHIDVHYQSDVIIEYRTSLEFTVIDLIANFGGIFGLCLGASLVSAVELLYYATFGFGLYLYDNDYFVAFKTNLKNLKQKWAFDLKNSFMEKGHAGDVVRTSFRIKHHPLHKSNRW